MHSPLAEHLHPMCQEAIKALQECHSSHPYRKFVGVCNSAKFQLDKCLADEYLVRRELNAQKAKQKRERVRMALESDQ